ncbi:MAG: ComF family protein, partial [Pseudomonadota bacterium]
MSLTREIAAGLRPVIDLVYPPRCPLCGVAVANAGGLCFDCWSELETPPEAGVDENGHAAVIAPTIYNDASRQLVLNFKHGAKVTLAGLMGQMMAGLLPDASGKEAPLLVPVPLHRLRLWERGFNQAALLAREVAKRGKGELCVDALIRTKRTPSLGGLGKAAREEALREAIAARSSRQARIRGRDVLLVDDVFTSGATSSACISALNDAGARSVRIVCFAKV